MLIYDPALDLSHYVFRLLRFLEAIENIEVEVEKYRIIDFYVLYPTALAKFRSPGNSMTEVKKVLKSIENKYNSIQSPKLHFKKIENLQNAALTYMVSIQILDAVSFKGKIIKRTTKSLPLELMKKIQQSNATNDVVEKYIYEDMFALPLLGSKGLKDRSELLEYKYDAL